MKRKLRTLTHFKNRRFLPAMDLITLHRLQWVSLSSAIMPVMCSKNHWTFSRSLPMTQGFSIAYQVKWGMRSSDALSHWSTVAITKGCFDLLLTQRCGLTSIWLWTTSARSIRYNWIWYLPYLSWIKSYPHKTKFLMLPWSLKAPHHASFVDKRSRRLVTPCVTSELDS